MYECVCEGAGICVSVHILHMCVCLPLCKHTKILKAETDSDISSDSDTKEEKGSVAQSLKERQEKERCKAASVRGVQYVYKCG